jgi:hypothetical protein
LVILDPFVKLHALGENDNAALDAVADLLMQLAHEYNVAIDSPAHTRKGMIAAGDSDARRGASAVRDASRLDYTLIPMSEDEAESFGIDPDERRFYLRLDNAKVNLLPPAARAQWFRLVDVPLGNCTPEYPEGDRVQTVEAWEPPDILDGLDPKEIEAALEELDAGLLGGCSVIQLRPLPRNAPPGRSCSSISRSRPRRSASEFSAPGSRMGRCLKRIMKIRSRGSRQKGCDAAQRN